MSIKLFAACIAVYLGGGGRVTVALAASVALWLYSRNRILCALPMPPHKEEKESPIYAVDFTGTVPPERTPMPQGVKSVKLRTRKARKGPTVVKANSSSHTPLTERPIYLFYTTLTGASQRVAQQMYDTLTQMCDENGLQYRPKLLSLDDDVDDLEEYFLKCVKNSLYVLVLPSYETDLPIDYFLEHLKDVAQDFRIDKYPLRSVAFAVLGLGDSELWPNKFCYQAQLADKWMAKLGAQRVFPLGQVCIKFDGEQLAHTWLLKFAQMIQENEPVLALVDSDDEDASDGEDVADVEDLLAGDTKQMVGKDSPTYKSLTKQGYTIVGLHLGVKICRWTKLALRGRGSCYKFAFYGIRSHLCMENTPLLACLNKCVFCWRHGTNPVAKLNWRWEVDKPEVVLEGALAGHYQKIKQMRGVPGIQMDRFDEAFQVKHCALSLVGEPIFYPYINEFVGMLHDKHISSFLVCNAQHPDNLRALHKVTQLYVSIDAPTKKELKKVDRPLNADFWERLEECLDILRTVQSHQRTVFRLTLVKGFNMGDVSGYADMVERARPLQIEVKGATFCGLSTANGNPLTMQNIPFYEECKNFVNNLEAELQARGLPYLLAAEHAHSCCILLADTKFKVNGEWNTHIDYPKFFELLESGADFVDTDYIKPTPKWAVWGSEEGGFNPEDTRYDRKAEKLKKKQEREAAQQKVQEALRQMT